MTGTDSRHRVLNGIIDRELAVDGEMPEIDHVQLMLGRRYATHRAELGDASADIIDEGLHPDEVYIIGTVGRHLNTAVRNVGPVLAHGQLRVGSDIG